jgi:hypothetical protein
MATRTVVCPDCSEPLTLGRLSCSNCGSLLASVAGAPPRTRPLRTVVIDEPPWLSDDDTLGWLGDEAAAHEEFDGAEPRSRQAAAAPPTPEPAPEAAPFVVEPPPQPAQDAPDGDAAEAIETGEANETDGAAEAPDAVLAEPEPQAVADPELAAEPDVAAEAEVATEAAEPEAEADAEPASGADTEPPAADVEPVPDPESSPDVEPVASDEATDDETQLSWVDLGVAAISGADQATEPVVEQLGDVPVDSSAPDPEPSPVEPDVPAAEPVATMAEPQEAPAELEDEPVGAAGDVDDAAEPPPPGVLPARPTDRWKLADLDDTPARPLQPSHLTRSRLDLTARPVAESAAREWEPVGSAAALDAVVPEPPAGAWLPPAVEVTDQAAAAPEPAPRESARRPDVKLDAPDDLPTGLSVVGSGIATLGFLLPWAAALPGSTGWTDRWGLADPSHGLVFLASAVLLGLSIVPNRVPAWIRTGVLPLGLGGLLLGLVWPAMLGASGMQLGAVAVTFSGFLLVAGGAIGVSRARRERSEAPV